MLRRGIYLKPLFKILVFYSIFVLLFTGCESGKISMEDKKKTIEVIAKADFDFWQVVKLGAEAAGKEFGIDVVFNAPYREEDIVVQIQMVNNAINRKADAIIIAASDFEKLVEVSERAIDSGIPVIVIDSALNSKKISSFIATDNIEAGRRAGKKLIELVGEKSNIIIMDFIKGAGSSDQRKSGLMDVLKRYEGINILDTEYSYSDIAIAEDRTNKVLAKYNNIDAFVALNSKSTLGVAYAIQKMDLGGKIKIIGFDCSSEEVGLIEEGIIQTTIVQNPYSMGYMGVKTAVDILNHKKVDAYIDTGSKIIDKNNIYTPENQKLLFPFIN
jgi:ribose transport system substrate-binding protein